VGIPQNGHFLIGFPDQEAPVPLAHPRQSDLNTLVLRDEPFAWKTGNRENLDWQKPFPNQESGGAFAVVALCPIFRTVYLLILYTIPAA